MTQMMKRLLNYRFDLNRLSAELLKSEADKGLDRTVREGEKRATERWMKQRGLDPAAAAHDQGSAVDPDDHGPGAFRRPRDGHPP
jgi:hypothetical protein